MVRNNKLTLIVIGLAILVFILTQIIPVFTGEDKSKNRKPQAGNVDTLPSNPFEHEAMGWFISPLGDTISQLDLELSQTSYEVTRGLMHRREMEENQGMLFEFKDEQNRAFWMKNTILSLDIIYLKADGRIDSHYEFTQPLSEKSLPSNGPSKYVLEVNAGYLKANKVNDSALFVFESINNEE